MKKKLIVLSSLALGFMPVVALAQGAVSTCAQKTGDLFGILCTIGRLLNAIVPVLIIFGVVWFIWGVVSYVIGDDEEAKKKGRDRMIFGIIGLAVIVGMWGLVNILGKTFGIESGSNPDITLPTVIIK